MKTKIQYSVQIFRLAVENLPLQAKMRTLEFTINVIINLLKKQKQFLLH